MIPKPRLSELDDDLFTWDRRITMTAPSGDEAGQALCRRLHGEFRSLGLGRDDAPRAARIDLAVDPDRLGPEAYRMTVEADRIEIVGGSWAGVFYATRTLLSAGVGEAGMRTGRIEDEPRYQWRGAHLDVARHFFPVEAVKRFIDLIALHKMNVFHWHLTEDQGWRIQIDAFPRLTEVAAYRSGGAERYGGYYTKDEVREVVAYAAERFVTVVPEIEMPGHAVAALTAYPELSCTGGPFEVETNWGIFEDVYCVGQEATVRFLEQVLDEVIELFPAEFFHIGGDECPKVRWKACEKCQTRIRNEGLRDEEELQSWFVTRMSKYLSDRGRRLVGWDEILEGGLAPGATVMSWRGTEGGIRAARMNHDVVMSPTSHCYFDYKQSPAEDEPGAWFAPALDLEKVYSYEPTPKELTEEQAAHILGVQANVWTEKMPHFQQVEYMTFPRLCALSEVAWSSGARNYDDFLRRLERHRRLLDALEVGYCGSRVARPVRPTSEDRERYLAALRERENTSSMAAY